MEANRRGERDTQTNSIANEKWSPGAKGKTADDGPLDHTYPQALGEDQLNLGRDTMGANMQNELGGGSGTVQGITDSHQREMARTSGAHGILEEPLGHRSAGSRVDVSPHRAVAPGPAYGAGSLQSASMQSGNMQAGGQSGTGGGMHGPQSAPAGLDAGPATGNRRQKTSLYVSDNSNRGGGMPGSPVAAPGNAQEAHHGNTQLGVAGSRAMSNRSASGGVHQSNDAAGGLPRSPGSSGARTVPDSRSHAATADDGTAMHESNDAAGGLPRSPGYANRLAGDRNMDDDTGFKRKP